MAKPLEEWKEDLLEALTEHDLLLGSKHQKIEHAVLLVRNIAVGTALVLFIVDTVALVVITFALYDSPMGKLVDFLLHIWAIVELVLAVRGSRKLKELPPTEEPRNVCTGPEF